MLGFAWRDSKDLLLQHITQTKGHHIFEGAGQVCSICNQMGQYVSTNCAQEGKDLNSSHTSCSNNNWQLFCFLRKGTQAPPPLQMTPEGKSSSMEVSHHCPRRDATMLGHWSNMTLNLTSTSTMAKWTQVINTLM